MPLLVSVGNKVTLLSELRAAGSAFLLVSRSSRICSCYMIYVFMRLWFSTLVPFLSLNIIGISIPKIEAFHLKFRISLLNFSFLYDVHDLLTSTYRHIVSLIEFLRTIAHLRARTNTISAVSRVRSSLAYATHKFFQEEGFLYLQSPLITASDCEGAGESFYAAYSTGFHLERQCI
jgi:aspartyl/asparaginyl-tRNA synthetase